MRFGPFGMPRDITMVGKGGFEPPTPCSQSRCATELRYFPFHQRLEDVRRSTWSPKTICGQFLYSARQKPGWSHQPGTLSPL